jgi:arsenate reductase (glutaredoxin)
MQVTIYHNPRCSKSRQALALLEDNNIKPQVYLYLKQPLSLSELSSIAAKLTVPITNMVRFNESLAKELNITSLDARGEQEWLELLADNPILLQRPIVVFEHQALIARPPQDLLAYI